MATINSIVCVSQYAEVLDSGGSGRSAVITVTTTRSGADPSTSTIAFSPPSLMTSAELTDYQVFVDLIDEQIADVEAAVDGISVQPAT